MEAEKIKKKLNGAILKGKKVKVEEARPKKRKHNENDAEDQQSESDSGSLALKKHKSKKDRNVIPGHELPAERKVKRGWTESKAASTIGKTRKDKEKSSTKLQPSSKYSGKDELLFKTVLPENKASIQNDNPKKMKRKRTKDGSDVVHEFEKNITIPSFLRSSIADGQKTVAYEDGKGWIDEHGETVEAENRRSSRRREAARNGVEHVVLQTQPPAGKRQKQAPSLKSPTGDSGLVPSDNTNSSDNDDKDATSENGQSIGILMSDETSSSGSSTSDNPSNESSDSDSGSSSSEDVQSTNAAPPGVSIHPLEALFKKPIKPASSHTPTAPQDAIKPSLEVQTSFSFFEREDNDSLPPIPMTPFSSQDLRSRELRSAAPTPDTAHPSRMSSIFNGEESEGELSDMPEDVGGEVELSAPQKPSTDRGLEVPQTDFEKQFWEKRGENNRAWKARRRAVLKDNRQRENRSRRPKNW